MDLRIAVRLHLQYAAAAYGGDLMLAAGTARAVAAPLPAAGSAPSPLQPATQVGLVEPVNPQVEQAELVEPVGQVEPVKASTAGAAPVAATPPRQPVVLPAAAASPVEGSPMPQEAAAPAAPAAPQRPAATATPGPPRAAAPKPPLDAAQRFAALQALQQEVEACQRCKLCRTRKRVVFGEGNADARVMFIGEAPGAVEDRTGRPFVGPAGQLLDRIITGAMGLRREDVFIGNVNKCRPPDNREPEPDEVAACLPYLRAQVGLVQPEAIVALGRVAAHNLLGSSLSMGRLRGRPLQYEGIPVVATWHPAYLLRTPEAKRDTWDDIKRLNRLLGLPEVPASRAGGEASA